MSKQSQSQPGILQAIMSKHKSGTHRFFPTVLVENDGDGYQEILRRRKPAERRDFPRLSIVVKPIRAHISIRDDCIFRDSKFNRINLCSLQTSLKNMASASIRNHCKFNFPYTYISKLVTIHLPHDDETRTLVLDEENVGSLVTFGCHLLK